MVQGGEGGEEVRQLGHVLISIGTQWQRLCLVFVFFHFRFPHVDMLKMMMMMMVMMWSMVMMMKLVCCAWWWSQQHGRWVRQSVSEWVSQLVSLSALFRWLPALTHTHTHLQTYACSLRLVSVCCPAVQRCVCVIFILCNFDLLNGLLIWLRRHNYEVAPLRHFALATLLSDACLSQPPR